METYLLILYSYDDEDDALMFCTDFFPHDEFDDTRFVIETSSNILIKFKSDKTKSEISKILYRHIHKPTVMINVYLLIKLKDMVSVYLPEQLKLMGVF